MVVSSSNLIKFPENFTPDDWLTYLIDALAHLGNEYDAPNTIGKAWKRSLSQLTREGTNPYVVALCLDIVAMDWGDHPQGRNDPWMRTRADRFLRPIMSYHRPNWFWRAVWFSRYARTSGERRFFSYWLSVADSAIGDAEKLSENDRRMENARRALTGAEQTIRDRDDEQPAWLLDWIYNRRESFSRWNNKN